jgi:hypothetical protein
LLVVSVAPATGLPASCGAAVLAGAPGADVTALAGELADAAPEPFAAVTVTSSVASSSVPSRL